VSSFFSSAVSSSTLGAVTFFLGLAVEAFFAGVESPPFGVFGALSFVTLGVFFGYYKLVNVVVFGETTGMHTFGPSPSLSASFLRFLDDLGASASSISMSSSSAALLLRDFFFLSFASPSLALASFSALAAALVSVGQDLLVEVEVVTLGCNRVSLLQALAHFYGLGGALLGLKRGEASVHEPCAMYHVSGVPILCREQVTYNSLVAKNITGKVRSFAFLPPSLKSSRREPSALVVLTGREARSDSGSISSSQMMAGHGG
jgi:hypothetical protein